MLYTQRALVVTILSLLLSGFTFSKKGATSHRLRDPASELTRLHLADL